MDNVFSREYGLLIFSPVGWILGIYFFLREISAFFEVGGAILSKK
jgi:hypothetical protein